MSTAPFPSSFAAPSILSATAPAPDGDLQHTQRKGVRRRGNPQQGKALEALGHAIEYLTDSGLFATGLTADSIKAEAQAVQILMRASRAVFEECAEVVPLHWRVTRWFDRRVLGLHW